MPDRKEGGDGGEVAYDLLRAGVGDALPGVANVDTAALHAWALVHGLAMLILDRRIDWDEAMVAEVVGLTFGGVGCPRNGRAAAAEPIYISGLFSPFGLTGCMTKSLSPRVEEVFWLLLNARGYFILASLSLHGNQGPDRQGVG